MDGTLECQSSSDARFSAYGAVPLNVGDCGSPGRWFSDPESADALHWTLNWSTGSDTTCGCGTDCFFAVNPDRYAVPSDQHEAVHRRWEFGVPVTKPMQQAIESGRIQTIAAGIVRIEDPGYNLSGHDESAPGMPVRDEVARRFGREWFVAPPVATTTLLALRGDRAVALAVLDRSDAWRWADEPPTPDAAGHVARHWTQHTPCQSIAVIWTAHAWRGEGIGRELVAAARMIHPTLPLAFSMPFSSGGLALARAIYGGDHFPVTR